MKRRKIELKELDNVISGRIEPKIYAFKTKDVKNALKVGDTYRGVDLRLGEWENVYPDLQKVYEHTAMVDKKIAKIKDDLYFRDYSVHSYLKQKDIKNLEKNEEKRIFSNEFFENLKKDKIEEAINDINKSVNIPGNYTYYTTENLPTVIKPKPIGRIIPRDEQKETIKKFEKIYDTRKDSGQQIKLLMYAVMRFGKSFTALSCAQKANAKIIVIVSAKDVVEEWRNNVEAPDNFRNDYEFIDSKILRADNNAISKVKDKRVVVFLTLQDLMGKDIKEKHKELFSKEIDFVIVDETHFGARADKYGQVLKKQNTEKEKQDLDEFVEAYDAEKTIEKTFAKAKVVLHLSGTPYRILMSGNEFKQEDIISSFTYEDIIEAEEKWYKKNITEEDENKKHFKEYDNPYFGFPRMVRFAFNPNESARKRLEMLKKNGISYAFSTLFKTNGDKFIYEKEVVDLLKVIDGTKEDDELFSFLEYDKIQEGQMCKHMVMVLPYKTSCDALELILKQNKFKHLNEYKIINVAGNNSKYKKRQNKSISAQVKAAIRKNEEDHNKTITLTVNKLLTGTTIEEWDTMLYLKDTTSPQEYDQAVFRLQTPYVKKLKGNDAKVIMKPQTLLVDFNPNRMFYLEVEKAKIISIQDNTQNLEHRLEKQLELSPIISLNANKMVKINPTNIVKYALNYSRDRSVVDEVADIPVDLSLIEKSKEVLATISLQEEFGDRSGLAIKNTEDASENLDMFKGNNKNKELNENHKIISKDKVNDIKLLRIKQFRTYYARILFFAYLSKNNVESLKDIINTINDGENKRIAKNLMLNKKILEIINNEIDKRVLINLNDAIKRNNLLLNDTFEEKKEDDISKDLRKAQIVMKKFNKLSASEIVTPNDICDKMVKIIPKKEWLETINKNGKILDIASKQGEFTIAIFEYLKDKVNIEKLKNSIYSIPTSTVAYEFTRKIYEILKLNCKNIIEKFTTYDLIEKNKTSIGGKKMKFDIIVGNPPYQKQENKTSNTPIYHSFVDIAYNISDITCLITPARFLFNAGKTPKEWNKKMLNDEHLKVAFFEEDSYKIFDTDIPGGIAITYRSSKETFKPIGTFYPYPEMQSIIQKVRAQKFKSFSDFIYSPESYKFTQILHEEHPEIAEKLSKGHLFDLTSNIFNKLEDIVFFEKKPDDDQEYIKIYGRKNNTRKCMWILRKYVKQHENLDKYKILLPKSQGCKAINYSTCTPIIGTPIIAGPNTGHTQTFISIGCFNENEANAIYNYIKTKFVRLLVGSLKVTQDNKKSVWENVPMPDLSKDYWNKTIKEIDEQLFKENNLEPKEIEFIKSRIKDMD